MFVSHSSLALVNCSSFAKIEVKFGPLRVLWFCHPAIFNEVSTFALLAFGSIRRLVRDFASLTFLCKEVLS